MPEIEINPLILSNDSTVTWLRRLFASHPDRSDFPADDLFTISYTNKQRQEITQQIKLTHAISYETEPIEIKPPTLNNLAQKWLIRLFDSHPNEPHYAANELFLVAYTDEKTGKSVIREVKLTDEIVQWKNARNESRYGIGVEGESLGKGAFTSGVKKLRTFARRNYGGLREITYKSRAMKVLKSGANAIRLLFSEVKMLRQTGHLGRPKPVSSHHSETQAIIMDLAEGDDLDIFLNKYGTELSARDRYDLSIAILKAYKEQIADKEVVHIDVKMENIKIKRTDTGAFVIKFIDLGLAVNQGTETTYAGTPGYMAAEMNALKGSDSKIKATQALDIPGLQYTLTKIWEEPSSVPASFFKGNDLTSKDRYDMKVLFTRMTSITKIIKITDVNKVLNQFQEQRRNYLYDITNDSKQTLASAVKLAKADKQSLLTPQKVLDRKSITLLLKTSLDQLGGNKLAISEYLYALDIPELNIAPPEVFTTAAVLAKLEKIFTSFDSNFKSLQALGAVERAERLQRRMKSGNHPWLVIETKNLFSEIEGLWRKFEKKEPSLQSVLELNSMFPTRFAEIEGRYKKWQTAETLLQRLAGVKRIQQAIKSEDSALGNEIENLSKEIKQLWREFKEDQSSPSVLKLDDRFLSSFDEIEVKYKKWQIAEMVLRRLETVAGITKEIRPEDSGSWFSKKTDNFAGEINKLWQGLEAKASLDSIEPDHNFLGDFAKIEERYKKWQKAYESYFWDNQLAAELLKLQGDLESKVDDFAKFKKTIIKEIGNYHQHTQKLHSLFYLHQPPDVERIGNIKRILREIKSNEKNPGALFNFVTDELTTIKGGVFGNSRLKKHLQLALDNHPVVPERGANLG